MICKPHIPNRPRNISKLLITNKVQQGVRKMKIEEKQGNLPPLSGSVSNHVHKDSAS